MGMLNPTHSLTHSLTHPLTQSNHSLTHSLTLYSTTAPFSSLTLLVGRQEGRFDWSFARLIDAHSSLSDTLIVSFYLLTYSSCHHSPPSLALLNLWVSRCLLKQIMMEVVVTTGAISLVKLHSNHHHQQTNIQFLLQAGCPSCRPTNSVKALKGKISHSVDLLTPSSPGGLPTLSLTTNSSWFRWGRVAMPLISPQMPVPHISSQLHYP